MNQAPERTSEDQQVIERVEHSLGGRYEVGGLLGRGGMGRVWLAWDRVIGRDVALKVLDPLLATSVEHRERFRREALIAARFPHPHVVQCFEFRSDREATVAVMRYVRGEALEERLRDGRRLAPDVVGRILVPIADALAHLHRHGVVHRDVKPSNILLQVEDGRPFLTDFGIATLSTSEQSRAEVVRRYGTPAFMAPEQIAGDWEADHRSDVYSLGLVAFSALAGRLPFRGGAAALMAQRLALDAPPPLCSLAPDVSPALGRVIDRCLAREPRRRWPDAGALRDALARAVLGGDFPRGSGRWSALWERMRTWWNLAPAPRVGDGTGRAAGQEGCDTAKSFVL